MKKIVCVAVLAMSVLCIVGCEKKEKSPLDQLKSDAAAVTKQVQKDADKAAKEAGKAVDQAAKDLKKAVK